MYIMIHFNNNQVASSAAYTIDDYNNETAMKKRSNSLNNLGLALVMVVGLCGLYLTIAG